MPETVSKASHLVAIACDDGAVPAWVHLLPAGSFDGRPIGSSGPYTLADAGAVIAASLAQSAELVIDYDHQTDFSAKPGVGGKAPAAGWIKELQARQASDRSHEEASGRPRPNTVSEPFSIHLSRQA